MVRVWVFVYILKIDNGFVGGLNLMSMRKREFEGDLSILFWVIRIDEAYLLRWGVVRGKVEGRGEGGI